MEDQKASLNVDSRGTVIITGPDGRQYDAQQLLVAIAKSPFTHTENGKEFSDKNFDQNQFPATWKGKWKIPVVYLFEGKYVTIYNDLGPNQSTNSIVLVSSFNLKKAKYISPEELKEIEDQRAEAAQESGRTHWGAKTPYKGDTAIGKAFGSPKRFNSAKPRFNGRG